MPQIAKCDSNRKCDFDEHPTRDQDDYAARRLAERHALGLPVAKTVAALAGLGTEAVR